MLELLAVLLIDDDLTRAEALKATAKSFWGESLTIEQALEHDRAAVFAAGVINDPVITADVLHGIAGHESRWTNAITHEVDPETKRWIGDSCGTMTPYDKPFRRCYPWELQPAGGFLVGALHLKTWADTCRRWGYAEPYVRQCALNRYAGGADDLQIKGFKAWQVFAGFTMRLEAEIKKRQVTPKS